MYTKTSFLVLMMMVFVPLCGAAQQIDFDIGAANWDGNFPGPGTYSQTISGIQVTGTADKIISNNIDPTAVFSGNDSPAVSRRFSYNFPAGSTVSIDFFHLTNNSSGLPESVGPFSPLPKVVNIGSGHIRMSLDQYLALYGSAQASVDTVTTLTWVNIDSLSFDIATNGNVSFVGHRNLVVSGGQVEPQSVPSLSKWAASLLLVAFLLLFYLNHKKQSNEEVI